MKWSRAITRLQRANAGVLSCPTLDLPRLESAMRERDAAVQMIAQLDPEPLSEPEMVRLRLAFEAGAEIRAKLSSIYRAVHAELHHTKCVRAFLQGEPTLQARVASYD